MAEIFRNNRDAYRGALLLAAGLKLSVEVAYARMKEMLEVDELDFVDFEYQYYKLQENPTAHFDTDLERPACRGLRDLPLEVAVLIAGELDAIERIPLRAVNRWFRDAIDNAEVEYDTFCVGSSPVGIPFYVEVNGSQAYLMMERYHYPEEGSFFSTNAALSLEMFLRNPQFKTETFLISLQSRSLEVDQELIAMLQGVIDRNSAGLKADRLEVHYYSNNYLFPTIVNMLSNIAINEIHVRHWSSASGLLDLTGLNNWKSLESVAITHGPTCRIKSLEILANCENFDVTCATSGKKILLLINAILSSESFESGKLQTYSTMDPEVMKKLLGVQDEDVIQTHRLGFILYRKFHTFPFFLRMDFCGFELTLEKLQKSDVPKRK